eukprot:scaffold16323_cov23-Tisochrysis_lutea.AAC.1
MPQNFMCVWRHKQAALQSLFICPAPFFPAPFPVPAHPGFPPRHSLCYVLTQGLHYIPGYFLGVRALQPAGVVGGTARGHGPRGCQAHRVPVVLSNIFHPCQ